MSCSIITQPRRTEKQMRRNTRGLASMLLHKNRDPDGVNEISTNLENSKSDQANEKCQRHMFDYSQRPELRCAGPNDVNREAELERPSRVGRSDVAAAMC